MLAHWQVIDRLAPVLAVGKHVGNTAHHRQPAIVGGVFEAEAGRIFRWKKAPGKRSIDYSHWFRAKPVLVPETASLKQFHFDYIEVIRSDHPGSDRRMIDLARIRLPFNFNRPDPMPESESLTGQARFQPLPLIQVAIQLLKKKAGIGRTGKFDSHAQHRFRVEWQMDVVKHLPLPDDRKSPDQDDKRGGDLGNHQQPLEPGGAKMRRTEGLAF